jgi:hypothetical protein
VDNDADGQFDEGLTPPPDPPNGSYFCDGEAGWAIVCAPNWEDANNDPSDGCEAAREGT